MASENDMPKKRSAGGVIYSPSRDKFLTINVTMHGEIIFPKGTIEPNETPEQAAIREILEETGYQVRIKAPLGQISYQFDEVDGKRYQKTVDHFLLELLDESETPLPQLEESEKTDGFENLWLSFEEALERLTHQESKEILKKAQLMIGL